VYEDFCAQEGLGRTSRAAVNAAIIVHARLEELAAKHLARRAILLAAPKGPQAAQTGKGRHLAQPQATHPPEDVKI